MTENTALWDKLGKTDPAHTKTFKRAGGFSGTAIKPMFSYRRLTEEFGPCGTGWGVGEPTFQVVPGQNHEVLVFCTVAGWYLHEGEQRSVYGVGGDKVVTYIKANEQYNRPERWENDDEAFKKAFTDALTNAFKFVGVGADVHMGMFDDNKYVNDMRQHFKEEAVETKRQAPANISASTAMSPAMQSLWDELSSITTARGLQIYWGDNAKTINGFPPEHKGRFVAKKDALKAEFERSAEVLMAGE